MSHERRLEELYRARRDGFVGALRAVLPDSDEAEECVQEAFARALKAGSHRGGSLAAWVWRIALNAAIDRRRQGTHAFGASAAWGAMDCIEAAVPHEVLDPDLRDALLRLSPRRRLIVFLHYFGGLTQREIARLLGVPVGTVAATLSQARAALAAVLSESAPVEVGHDR